MEPVGFDKKKISEVMQRRSIDFIVASSPENVFYTCGLPVRHMENNPILFVLSNQYPTIVVIRQNGEESVIAWGLFDPALTWVKDFRGIMTRGDAVNAVISLMEEAKLSKPTIGVESAMPFYQFEGLKKAFPKAIFKTIDDIFLEMRLIKSPEEIDRIRKATIIAEKAILAMFEQLREGVTDIELLKVAKSTVVKEGALGWDHITMSLGSSDPEAPGTGVKMKKNELARFDVGAIYKGYCSDVSRHVALGKIPSGAKKIIAQIVDVQQKCADAIVPGVSATEVSRIGQQAYERTGQELPFFITCHGLGLQTEEFYFFSPMTGPSEIVFQPGMVFDLEIWAPFDPYRLIGMEDTYLVNQSGCQRISTLDRTLLVK
jgi:Xaa-Pro aminopeptidase